MMTTFSWDFQNPRSTLVVGFTGFAIAVATVVIAVAMSLSEELAEQGNRSVFPESGHTEPPKPLSLQGSVFAHSATLPDSTQAFFKITFAVSSTIADEPFDLTSDFTADGRGTDPHPAIVTGPVAEVQYGDKNQSLRPVPWTVKWLGSNDGDNLLEANEEAEITVWLLSRDNSVLDSSARSSAIYMSSGGMTREDTVLSVYDEFFIEMKHNPGRPALQIMRTVWDFGVDDLR